MPDSIHDFALFRSLNQHTITINYLFLQIYKQKGIYNLLKHFLNNQKSYNYFVFFFNFLQYVIQILQVSVNAALSTRLPLSRDAQRL